MGEGEAGHALRPALLQKSAQVPSESSPEEGGQADQRRGGREEVPVHFGDDVIIQGHDVTQLRLQQTFPEDQREV